MAQKEVFLFINKNYDKKNSLGKFFPNFYS